jgi:hypothetical protein
MNKTVFHLLARLLGLFSLLQPGLLHAADVKPPVVCGALMGCFVGGGGVFGLEEFLGGKILVILQGLFAALMIIMLLIYGATMIFKSSDESSISEAKQAYTYAIAGAAFASFSVWISSAFSVQQPASLINYDPVNSTLNNVYLFFKVTLGIALTVNLVLQAFRMITSEGSDELTGRARKRIVASFIGVGIVLLADRLIVALNPGTPIGVASANSIIAEIIGVVNFLLTLIAGSAVIAIIIAGLLLVISIDEKLKDQSKQIVRVSLISLAIVLAALALVNSFILLDISGAA